MLFEHKYFILDDKSKKVFDENKKELRLTGNAFRMLVFLSEHGPANLTEIGDYFDSAKDYNENHLRQYKYKINTVIGHDIVEYRNGVYSIIGDVKKDVEIKENAGNTTLLHEQRVSSEDNLNKNSQMKLTLFPAIASILILLLSFFHWPYGYYVLLRIVVCCSCAYYAYIFYSTHQKNFWFWGLIFTAVIFNPIVPIYLYDKTVWSFIDVIAAIGLAALVYDFKRKTIKKYEGKRI